MHNQKGFSLVELMIAVMIIALLAAVAYPSYYSRRERAMEAKVIANMHAAQMAVEDFASITDGIYPLDFAEQVNVSNPNIVDSTSVAGITGGFWPYAPCLMPIDVKNPVSVGGWAFASAPNAVSTPPVHPGGIVIPACGCAQDQGSFLYHSADVQGNAAVSSGGGGNAAKYAIYGYGVYNPLSKILFCTR